MGVFTRYQRSKRQRFWTSGTLYKICCHYVNSWETFKKVHTDQFELFTSANKTGKTCSPDIFIG